MFWEGKSQKIRASNKKLYRESEVKYVDYQFLEICLQIRTWLQIITIEEK